MSYQALTVARFVHLGRTERRVSNVDTSIEIEPVSVRVARGLAWITENGPAVDFDLDRVDLETLDVSAGNRCVTAQASGTGAYGEAAERVSDLLRLGNVCAEDQWARDHGLLDIGDDSQARVEDGQALTREWVRVLSNARQAT